MPEATVSNARDLGPEVLRNEIVDRVDQMERIEMGDQNAYASAMSVFPMLNLDDPDEAYYTISGGTGPMSPVSITSESPVGSLDLPSKEGVDITGYKKKYIPDKGTETHLSNSPFSVFQRAADQLRKDIFVTREQVAWRGDEVVDGMVGQFGNDPHPDLIHTDTVATAWSDSANATPYDDLTNLSFEIWDNGLFTGGEPALPTVFVPPSVGRDLKQTDDMQDRISGVRVRPLSLDDMASEVMDDEIGAIRQVLVNLPRQNADGEYIDENGNVVDEVENAAWDNALEPYDPDTDSVNRHVIIGRPGVSSAYMPWFSQRLLERAQQAPDPGNISVDSQNGFFTQVWNSNDPITANFKAGQEIGMEIQAPENWAVLQGV